MRSAPTRESGRNICAPVLSFGGPCFPARQPPARLRRASGRIAGAAGRSVGQNQRADEIEAGREGEGIGSAGGTVLVLGVSYKPDTYITEESAGLHLAQEMKRHGYRVLVHDFAANPSNNPALNEFEFLDELGELEKRDDVDLAVVCCPWPQYAKVKFSPKTKVLPTWELRPNDRFAETKS